MLKRQRVFRELDSWLRKIAKVVKEMDPEAEVYLFGSVAGGRYIFSSDIGALRRS